MVRFHQKHGLAVRCPLSISFNRSMDLLSFILDALVSSEVQTLLPSEYTILPHKIQWSRLFLVPGFNLFFQIFLETFLFSQDSSSKSTALRYVCVCVCACVCFGQSIHCDMCFFSVGDCHNTNLLLSNSYLTPQLSFPSTKACIVNLNNFIHTFIPRLFFHTLIHACYYFL